MYPTMSIKTFFPVFLLAAARVASAWNLTVYSDSACGRQNGSADGSGDLPCVGTPGEHRSLMVSNMGYCVLFLYNDVAKCQENQEDLLHYKQFHTAAEEGTCIPPDYKWDGITVQNC
jgi:hypothetical protein